MKTLLQLAQAVATEIQVPPPGAVVGLTDPSPRRMVRYANKAVDMLARAVDWNVLRREHTLTAVAGGVQADAFPADFGRMVPQTMWDRTGGRPLKGPVPAYQWQRLTTHGGSGPAFTIRGATLHVLPSMKGGETLAYEYISGNVVESTTGVGKSSFTVDTDVNRLDDELVILAMVVDWLAAESQPFEMPLSLFRQRLAMLSSHDNPTHGVLVTGVPGARYTQYDISTDWTFG